MWTVVIHKAKCSEFNIIAKAISKANAQLFAEDYALSYIVENDGNKEPTICKLADVESIVNDESKTSLDKHYLIKNTSPWGFNVVRAVISLLETKTTSEEITVETVIEMQEQDVTRQVEVPGKWYGKKIHKVVEKQIQPVSKEITVKHQKTVLSHVRSSNLYQVFQINLALDESISITSSIETDEVAKNNCKKFSEQLKLVPSFTKSTIKLSQLRVENPNDFSTRNSYQANLDMSKLLTRDSFARVWEESIDFDKPVKSVDLRRLNTPPVQKGQVFALACLNDDIIMQHKKMFNKVPELPKIHEPIETILTNDTMDALFNEIEQYINNAESSESESDFESFDSDSEDWEMSDQESDSHIFDPIEIMSNLDSVREL